MPHAMKQVVIQNYQRLNLQLSTFVETGTSYGDMAEVAAFWFNTVHTIELDPVLAESSRSRLAYLKHVHVHEGDSALVLPSVLDSLETPVLVWLDAHYSGEGTAKADRETPIERELDLVLTHPLATVVLVDDAREFGHGDYPSLDTVEEVTRANGWDFRVDMDIIRMTRDLPTSSLPRWRRRGS